MGFESELYDNYTKELKILEHQINWTKFDIFALTKILEERKNSLKRLNARVEYINKKIGEQ